MRRMVALAWILSFLLPTAYMGHAAQAELPPVEARTAPQAASQRADKIAPDVQATLGSLSAGEMISVIVTLRDQADLSQIPGSTRAARLTGIIKALQALASASQRAITTLLEVRQAQGLVSQVTPFWVFNGLAVTATQGVIEELAARPDVSKITPDEISVVPDQIEGSPSELNLSIVNAPELWVRGFYGQGIVVANMDSGVDVNHPDLSGRWRGGTNSWFDPYGQHPSTPTDLSGHGTWTMGVMVGGDAGGTFIGTAPQAQWIAVKIFSDAGSVTASAIHQGFQWLLDPDGNPNTADAPHVVNNSWTFANPGCDLEFELDMQSLRAGGILSVFAAGNGGPSAGTSYSPSNNPSAFAVGATHDNDLIYAYSSRGPSGCGEATTIFPELVAPGVAIHTTGLLNGYYDATGTSLAAPHVAGGLALLLSAYPDLTAARQENALKDSAADLGAAGPDNDFGYGRLDVLAAYQWLASIPPATPTPTATPDPNANLALNRLVTISSSQDTLHAGAMAVDGNLATAWQTAKVVGKNKPSSEWIAVDLGSNMSIGRVVLEWETYYATSYSLQVSNDSSAWTTVFSTAGGDGAGDIITFSPAQARYVRLDSTAWNSGNLRNWLREFQVYAGGGPVPTATPTPPPTSTPGSGTTMHVGDLDGSSSLGSGGRWNATITITVHDVSHNPVSGATVNGTWSNGVSGTGSCLTDITGECGITKSNIKGSVSSATFTADTVSHSSALYQPSANHDPDGDSNGSSIAVLRP